MDFKAQTPVVGMTNITDRDPPESINTHRKLFEKYGFKLTDATYLSDLIPMVLAHEIIAIKNEISQSKVHIVFDGAAYDGECFCLHFRFI